MKKLQIIVALLVFALFLPITTLQATGQKEEAAASSPQELFGRLSPSVFVVEALNKRGSVVTTGSAVVVAPGEVVTNKHVIKKGVAWRVRHGSKTWPAILTHLDSAHDLCQLKADGLKAPPVPVRASSTLAVGERVYAIGAPEGLELSLSEGLISGLREFETVRLIQTSAAISHGSSGGGLFDAQGRLVGITTFFLKEGQNLNFALPGEWVQALATQQFSEKQRTETDSPAFGALEWSQLGWEADEAGDYEKAVRAYREAIRIEPNYPGDWINLGSAYDSLRQYDQAIKAYQEAIRLAIDLDREAMRITRDGHHVAGLIWFAAVAWRDLGITYSHLNQFDQEVRAYQEAIRLKPDYADAWYMLGLTYFVLEQDDQAVRTLREAIRLKPDYAEAWYSLGLAYSVLEQYDQALRAFQEAIRIKPDDAKAWYRLGSSYSVLKQYDQAVRTLQEVIRLKPDFAEAWCLLGSTYDDLKQYDQAVRALQEAIRLKPDYTHAWYLLGNPYIQLDQYDQAVKAYQEAIRLKPDDASAWFCLGITYSLQHNRSKMMQVYEMLKTLERDRADKFFQKFVLP